LFIGVLLYLLKAVKTILQRSLIRASSSPQTSKRKVLPREKNMMHRKKLKLALVAAELSHWRVASAANKLLPEELHLSEFDITRLVCKRKNPSFPQAEALAAVLGCSVESIFPDLGTNSSNVRNPKGGEA
jgi:hypothetical protein